MTDNASIREAYATLIHDQEWDFYSTVTYRTPRHDSIRAAGRYWATLSDKFDADRAFIVAEPHRLDGLHLHALSRHALRPELQAQTLWKYCFAAYGRYQAECVSGTTTALVTWYVSKYVTKGDPDGYFLFGDSWNKG